MKNLAVFISGGGSNFQALIDAVNDKIIDARICAVISSNADAYGLTRAKDNGIQTFVCPKSLFDTAEKRDEKIIEILKPFHIDYIILAGYLGIVTRPLVDAYPNRIVNIHPALLPKYGGKNYYGLHVHRAVIEAKEPFSGATVHFVDYGTDTGPIILQERLRVEQDDTPEILQARILEKIEHPLLVRAVSSICADKVFVDNGKVTIKQ